MIFPNAPEHEAASPMEGQALNRRRVIGSLGLVGLGWMASTNRASAFSAPTVTVPTRGFTSVRPQDQPIDLTALPADWARNQGNLMTEYAQYLWRLKLKSITPAHVIAAHAKCKGQVWNTLPPKTWWSRMAYTLKVVDRIAVEMNVKEVEVVSAYRCPSYNAHCDGAKSGSWHQANVALDVKFPVRASLVTATSRNLRDRGLFKGGVGGYSDFTHIDTRGENMNW